MKDNSLENETTANEILRKVTFNGKTSVEDGFYKEHVLQAMEEYTTLKTSPLVQRLEEANKQILVEQRLANDRLTYSEKLQGELEKLQEENESLKQIIDSLEHFNQERNPEP